LGNSREVNTSTFVDTLCIIHLIELFKFLKFNNLGTIESYFLFFLKPCWRTPFAIRIVPLACQVFPEFCEEGTQT